MAREDYLLYGARCTVLRGEDRSLSKLTDANVQDIRRLHARKTRIIKRLNEKFSASALAKKYNVHPRTIEKALRLETWTHIK